MFNLPRPMHGWLTDRVRQSTATMRIAHYSPPQQLRTHGSTTTLLISGLVIIAIVVIGVLLYPNDQRSDHQRVTALYTVQRGDFTISIPASGELLAKEEIEIRNQLESRAVITEVIDEGDFVNEGDVLLRLNDEEIRRQIKEAEEAVNTAHSELISAEANLAIRKSTRDSDIDRAELELQLAELALMAWKEGELAAKRQQLDLAVERAQRNYDRMKQRVRDSERLFERQFISKDELDRERIAKIEARADLLQARKDLEVYNTYTYKQERAQMRSNVDQARAELERVRQRHEAEIETARAEVSSKRFQLESRKDRLADRKEQLENTVVRAPSDALVVYASSLEFRRGWMHPPDVGMELSRNELVMLLPDTSRMVASVRVNEALSGLIELGQSAIVVSDAVSSVAFDGEVIRIGVLPGTGDWRDPFRRDYSVRIKLHDIEGYDLRPSMRCRANIYIDQVEDAIYAPVQAIFHDGSDVYVSVLTDNGFAQHPIRVGRASETYVEILEGLAEGDRVLLRRP